MAIRVTTSRLQRRRAFFRRLRIYGYGAGIILLALGIGYLVIISPLFKISSVVVEGGETIDRDALLATLKKQVAASRLGWLGTDNYLAWPSGIDYSTAQVKDVSVKKSIFSRSIVITASARDRYAVWCANRSASGEPCYWVDPSGIMFARAPVAEGQLVQTIYDDGTATIGAIGDPVLASSSFLFVKKIIAGTKRFELRVHSMTVSRALQELILETATGARVNFSLRFDPEPTALPALARFMEKPGLDKLEYVNLTVENRAFIKTR